MYGMAQAVTDLIEQGAAAFDTAVPILSQLLKAELAEREVRSIAYHMRLPVSRLTKTSPALTSLQARSMKRRCVSGIDVNLWMGRRMLCLSAVHSFWHRGHPRI